ncbi:putative reverse transcriptase domain-containing protein [Tanacetum coccineum]
MINQGVTPALAARDANRTTNGDDNHNSGTGVRRTERAARECTYIDFLKCQPLNFKGTEGVVGLSQWLERMKSVFYISNCTVENQVKFATCTLHSVALTWWNTNVKTKLEMEIWDLKVKGTDLTSYTQRFQELALLCGRMFLKESDKIEKYVGGLLNMIHGSVVASKPKTMQDAVEISIELMDKKIQPTTTTTTTTKQEAEHWQGLVKRNNMRDLNPYAQNATITMTVHVLPDATSQKPTCYENEVQGHFKRECPKLKNNNNRGNQVGGGNAPAKVYAVGRAWTNLDSNFVTGTFLLNNRYASILFDTGTDRSFVSTAFSSQINITPSTFDHYYDVELVDGRIIGLNTILRGCILNILNHPFNIHLMPVELGSFNAIIAMDWLAKYQEIIVCAEKIARIPWGNETLIVYGDGSNREHEARLHIISYSKTQEYMQKGCPVFLAYVTTKEVEDKSEKMRLKDVPIVQDFPKVFSEGLSGLPPTQQVEFQIDLIPGAAPVARAPY